MIMDNVQAEYKTHVSIEQLKKLIQTQLESEGYKVISITEKKKQNQVNVGGMVTGYTDTRYEFDGFEVKARKIDNRSEFK